MWPVFGEYVLSLLWAYVMAGLMLLWLLGQLVALPPQWTIPSLLPQWHGVILGATCLCQFALSMAIDRRYERGVGRNFYWMIWYPIAYWLLSMLTSVFALPKALAKKRGTRAVWVSPDRGIR